MELQLKNIGMIKEANVKIDGLTVIAGENDTGKSTVGKALYGLIEGNKNASAEETLSWYKNIFIQVFKDKLMYENGIFTLFFNKQKLQSIYADSNTEFIVEQFSGGIGTNRNLRSIFIETPLVWNFSKFFRDIALVESQMNIEIDYPFFLKDLNFKLFIKNASNGIDIRDKMISLMGGQFEQDDRGDFFFNKNGKRIELENTSTGIKQFGIFQVLSQNNYLNENTVLVLDEPEVHLHPKWQLEMAKIIVELVEKGVKIVVNSHSPYMIQSLIKYARDKDIVDKSNFYLAEKNDDFATFTNVNTELNKIFELLAKPMNEVYE